MKNIIQNAQWYPASKCGPKFFSSNCTTYDDLCINGYRTQSITIPCCDCKHGSMHYDCPIKVCCKSKIEWGFCIRAAQAQFVTLTADFYDCCNNLLDSCNCQIEEQITCKFKRIMCSFDIPRDAYTAKLSIVFEGKVTALTLYGPKAYFC